MDSLTAKAALRQCCRESRARPPLCGFVLWKLRVPWQGHVLARVAKPAVLPPRRKAFSAVVRAAICRGVCRRRHHIMVRFRPSKPLTMFRNATGQKKNNLTSQKGCRGVFLFCGKCFAFGQKLERYNHRAKRSEHCLADCRHEATHKLNSLFVAHGALFRAAWIYARGCVRGGAHNMAAVGHST